MAVISGTIYRFTNAQFPSKALNVYAANTISARRNVCLYDDTPSDVMQQWLVTETVNGGYVLKCAANNGYGLRYSDGTNPESCAENADVEHWSNMASADSLVNFEYLGNNRVKIKHHYTGKYLTAYSNANGGSNSITDVETTGNVYWATGSSTLGNKQIWNISPSIDEEDVTDGQTLIMPISNMLINVGYKVPIYTTYPATQNYGEHYGSDYINQDDGLQTDNIIASGNGYIYQSGWDNNVGYFACIVYPDALIWNNGQRVKQDITVRYWHMEDLSIPNVSNYNNPIAITKGSVIGTMGSEGVAATGPHLHVECDTDTTPQYTFWTPTHFSNPNIIKNGIDTTINPGFVFQVGASQSVCVLSADIGSWVLSDDYTHIGPYSTI